ncbi:MAG: DUF3536 domain-containing protein [Nitrospinota bacterium]|nr:MAG: DUF3536 domain-containing protein [Nitrospinota bacterium]
MERYLCIHGHFYQPPRENPWLEEVELQDSAYPYHDWNERITAECYAPNTASRILDPEGRIIDIVNNYAKMSFNFGPTLLSWLERHKPEVYQAIIDADKESRTRFSGHGSALAQVYNHMIMPLANRRDKYTQVLWGIRDFQHRFGRFPEGMWLPETAVDTETLEVLAECGITFTILAPRQARRIRPLQATTWEEVDNGRIDPTRPYLCLLPSGRQITLFFYDGPISQDLAFGGLLNSGEAFAQRLVSAFNEQRTWPQLVHIATDGETYGHHHRYGEMALSYCLHFLESQNLVRLTNYGEYLERHPPTHVVEIFENSSWSCIHGVERWREDCGCNSGMHPGWTQAWRRPLREAMDWLRDRLAPFYESTASRYLHHPWRARDEYISLILDRSPERVEAFLHTHGKRPLSREEKGTVLMLLEMQRDALLMYTSCGWFFDEISGIEPVQVMLYASQAMQYYEKLGQTSLEPGYLQILAQAPSNVYAHGAEPYEMFVKPARVDLLRVGAHYAISSLFAEYPQETQIFCYTAQSERYERREAGRVTLATGKATVRSDITWEETMMSFAVLHLGDHNIHGGVRDFSGEEEFSAMQAEVGEAFERGDLPEVIRRIDTHFAPHTYAIWHLFKDAQRQILDQILQSTYEGIEALYRQIYDTNYPLMNFLHGLQIPLPKPLAVAAEYIINRDLQALFAHEEIDRERLTNLIQETKRQGIELDRSTLRFAASLWITSQFERLSQQPEDLSLLETLEAVFQLLAPLSLDLDLWKAQNLYSSIGEHLYHSQQERAAQGDETAQRWVSLFHTLGSYLGVKVS